MAVMKLRDEIDSIKSEYYEKKRQLADSLREGQTGFMLSLYNEYFHSLEDREKKVRRRMQDIIAKKEEERKKLIAVVNDCKMLEKLKENQYQEYLAEDQRQQQLIINDIISYNISVD